MDPELERMTDPSYVEGIAARGLDEVRAKRAECQQLESSLSYARRVVQGHLDILAAESERRRAGGAAGDLSGLVEALPAILAERVGGGWLPRPPQDLGPSTERYVERIDAVLSADRALAPTDLDDAQLAEARTGLEALERELSDYRHRMHAVIDVLHAEITRRYRSGEASVDTLLQ